MAAAALLAAPLLHASPAQADVPESIAIGTVRDGDTRVLYVGGDGISDRSPVVIRSYVSGLSGSAVNRQRWTLEPVTGSGILSYSYRIKHVSSGKCLDKSQDNGAVNGAAIYLYACSTAKNQLWRFPPEPDYDGLRLRSAVDNRCLDVKAYSTAEGAALHAWDCADISTSTWNQLWMLRTGTVNCSARYREWSDSRMCISAGSAHFTGVMATWHHNPIGLAYKNPSTYVLSNSFRSRFVLNPIDSQGVQSGWVELGWQAQRNNSNGIVQYNGYWLESGPSGEVYHSIPAEDLPGESNGSTLADGRQHTYMALGTGTSGEWDLYYDYNFVGTTANQVGGRARLVDVGALARYLDAVTVGSASEYRTQALDGAGVWRRPYLSATATATPKTCGAPPVWDDYSGGAGGNTPPWCLRSGRFIQAGSSPAEVSSFNVVKPAVTATASQRTSGPEPLIGSGFTNGVDQAALADCLNTNADQCLQKVPGLQECVSKRLRCNGLNGSDGRRAPITGTLTTQDAKKRAVADLPFAKGALPRADNLTAKTAVASTLGRNLPRDISVNDQLLIVTGTGQLSNWSNDRPPTLKKWQLYYHQNSGRLLYGRMF